MRESEPPEIPVTAKPTTVFVSGGDEEARRLVNLAMFMGESVDVVAVGHRAPRLWDVAEEYAAAYVRPISPGLLIDRGLSEPSASAKRLVPDFLLAGGEALLMRHSEPPDPDDPAFDDEDLLAERDGLASEALTRRCRDALGLKRGVNGDPAWRRVVGAAVAAAASSDGPVLLTDEAVQFATQALPLIDPSRIRVLLTPHRRTSVDHEAQRDIGEPSAVADPAFGRIASRVLALASIYTSTAVPHLGEISAGAAVELRHELEPSLKAFRALLREVALPASGIPDGESLRRFLSDAAVHLEDAHRAYVAEVERNTIRQSVSNRWPAILGGAAGTGTTAGLVAAFGLLSPTVAAAAAGYTVTQLMSSVGEKVARSRQLRSAPLYWVLRLQAGDVKS